MFRYQYEGDYYEEPEIHHTEQHDFEYILLVFTSCICNVTYGVFLTSPLQGFHL